MKNPAIGISRFLFLFVICGIALLFCDESNAQISGGTNPHDHGSLGTGGALGDISFDTFTSGDCSFTHGSNVELTCSRNIAILPDVTQSVILGFNSGETFRTLNKGVQITTNSAQETQLLFNNNADTQIGFISIEDGDAILSSKSPGAGPSNFSFYTEESGEAHSLQVNFDGDTGITFYGDTVGEDIAIFSEESILLGDHGQPVSTCTTTDCLFSHDGDFDIDGELDVSVGIITPTIDAVDFEINDDNGNDVSICSTTDCTINLGNSSSTVVINGTTINNLGGVGDSDIDTNDGYVYLGPVVLMQWGRLIDVAEGVDTTDTFPETFGANPFCTTTAMDNVVGSGERPVPAIISVSTTQIEVRQVDEGGAEALDMTWQCVGAAP